MEITFSRQWSNDLHFNRLAKENQLGEAYSNMDLKLYIAGQGSLKNNNEAIILSPFHNYTKPFYY